MHLLYRRKTHPFFPRGQSRFSTEYSKRHGKRCVKENTHDEIVTKSIRSAAVISVFMDDIPVSIIMIMGRRLMHSSNKSGNKSSNSERECHDAWSKTMFSTRPQYNVAIAMIGEHRTTTHSQLTFHLPPRHTVQAGF